MDLVLDIGPADRDPEHDLVCDPLEIIESLGHRRAGYRRSQQRHDAAGLLTASEPIRWAVSPAPTSPGARDHDLDDEGP